MTDASVESVLREIEVALEEVSRLCKGKQWQMRIPVDEATDSDVVISRALVAARAALSRVSAEAREAPEPPPENPPQQAEGEQRVGAELKPSPTPSGIVGCGDVGEEWYAAMRAGASGGQTKITDAGAVDRTPEGATGCKRLPGHALTESPVAGDSDAGEASAISEAPAPRSVAPDEDELYEMLGQVKGINNECERHKSYPWQLHCETCRRFVARELAFMLASRSPERP